MKRTHGDFIYEYQGFHFWIAVHKKDPNIRLEAEGWTDREIVAAIEDWEYEQNISN